MKGISGYQQVLESRRHTSCYWIQRAEAIASEGTADRDAKESKPAAPRNQETLRGRGIEQEAQDRTGLGGKAIWQTAFEIDFKISGKPVAFYLTSTSYPAPDMFASSSFLKEC